MQFVSQAQQIYELNYLEKSPPVPDGHELRLTTSFRVKFLNLNGNNGLMPDMATKKYYEISKSILKQNLIWVDLNYLNQNSFKIGISAPITFDDYVNVINLVYLIVEQKH